MNDARRILEEMIAAAESLQGPIVYTTGMSGDKTGFAFGVGDRKFPEDYKGLVFDAAHQQLVADILRAAEAESRPPNNRIWPSRHGRATWFWPVSVNPDRRV